MKKLLLIFILSILATGLVISGVGTVSAQESESQKEKSESQKEDTEEFMLEDVVVTGSNISGVGAAIGSQTIVLDNAELQKTVAFDVSDVVQTLPQVQRMLTSDNDGLGTGTTTQGKAINLRGIGTNATLIMVDGHRVTPAGTASAFQEAVQVPMAALEQVEVVTDGLSAVYGSDAISGVVNYIMRKDYEGAEFNARYTTNSRGVKEWSTSILGGTSWKSLGGFGPGNIIASYEHSHQDPVRNSEFPGLRQDLTPVGGNDNRLQAETASAGNPGNIIVEGEDDYQNPDLPGAGNYTYYGLPAGNGVGLTVDDLLLNQPNLFDKSYYSDYRPESKRDYFTLYLTQEIKDYLEVFVEAYYTKRETESLQADPQFQEGYPNNTIDSTNPYYIAGIPGVDGGPITFQYDWYSHLTPVTGPFKHYSDNKALSVITGAKMRLPWDWNGDIEYSYGTDEGCGACYYGIIPVNPAWNELLANGEINPFSSEPLTQDIIDQFMGDNLQMNDNSSKRALIKFDGPLFHLPAGDVKAAVGYEYTKDHNNVLNGAHRTNTTDFIWDADTDTNRTQKAMFAELYVPIVGESSDIPLVQKVDFTASVRKDEYDSSYEAADVNRQYSYESTNPRFGMNWEIDDNIRLRGSWSTAFRAPSIPETDPGVFSAGFAFLYPNYSGRDDIATEVWGPFSTVLFKMGGNEELGPENGETWSVGVDFTPSFLDRFKLSGTFYRITYEDKIGSAGNMFDYLSSPEMAALYDKYIIPVTPVAGCDNGDPSTWPDGLEYWADYLYGLQLTNACEVDVVLDGRSQNVAATFQDGIDIQLSYGFDTSIGYWNIDVNMNKILTNEEQLTPTSPVVDILDRITRPVSFRARGNIGLYNDSWSANLYLNHIGSYTNDQPITLTGDDEPLPDSEVPSWTTFDLFLRYFFKESSIPGLSDLTLTMAITNLFDKDAPIVLYGNRAYDSSNHDIMGRTFQFSLIKEF